MPFPLDFFIRHRHLPVHMLAAAGTHGEFYVVAGVAIAAFVKFLKWADVLEPE